MVDPLDRAVRAIARRHASALVWLQFGVAHLVLLGGVGLLSLYEPLSTTQFWVLTAVSQGVVALDNAVSVKLTRRLWAPFARWERGERDRDATVAAWLALATLPIEYVRVARRYLLFSYLPLMAFFTWELRLVWYGFFVLVVVGSVVLAYAMILRFFMMEVVVRPRLPSARSRRRWWRCCLTCGSWRSRCCCTTAAMPTSSSATGCWGCSARPSR